MENADKILIVKNLKMQFPVKRTGIGEKRKYLKAVDDFSIEVERGKTFGLVGESGCGKTTAGKCILRIFRPTEGSILYNGRDISTASERELRDIRREIQLIFQDPYGSLDPRQSVRSILREAIVSDNQPHKSAEINERISELLSLVELPEEMSDRYPHEMSGGQRQRLGIARALACNPKLIVCDEPVSALDVSIQAQIINLFKKLQKKLNLTYIFIAHDLAVVKHIADVIAVMYLGSIVEMMTADELFQNPIHPYTKALLSAVPITDYYAEQGRNRIILEGEVPSPVNMPSGCPFHPRCAYATERCRTEKPHLAKCFDGHFVACHVMKPDGAEK